MAGTFMWPVPRITLASELKIHSRIAPAKTTFRHNLHQHQEREDQRNPGQRIRPEPTNGAVLCP
jgi:hypothetical protein